MKTTVVKPISPGMKYRHYSPNGDLIILDDNFENILKNFKKNNKVAFITYKKYKELLLEVPLR